MYVNLDAYKPVARLFGNLYAGLGPAFELKRQTYDEWRNLSAGDTGRACGPSCSVVEKRSGIEQPGQGGLEEPE
jgi:hypothetical protein